MAPSDQTGVCKLLLAEQKSFPHSKGDGRYGRSGLDERREQAIDVVEVKLHRKKKRNLKQRYFHPTGKRPSGHQAFCPRGCSRFRLIVRIIPN